MWNSWDMGQRVKIAQSSVEHCTRILRPQGVQWHTMQHNSTQLEGDELPQVGFKPTMLCVLDRCGATKAAQPAGSISQTRRSISTTNMFKFSCLSSWDIFYFVCVFRIVFTCVHTTHTHWNQNIHYSILHACSHLDYLPSIPTTSRRTAHYSPTRYRSSFALRNHYIILSWTRNLHHTSFRCGHSVYMHTNLVQCCMFTSLSHPLPLTDTNVCYVYLCIQVYVFKSTFGWTSK